MQAIKTCELPPEALLNKYRYDGAYSDCYSVDIARCVSHVEFVEAFYTTWLFKIERRLLKWFVAKPSTDSEVAQLAVGGSDSFSAWRVEARATNQLLLSDFQGRTRSWLMVENHGAITHLYFGSAVVPVQNKKQRQPSLGFTFNVLLGFHQLYSRALLSAARSRLS